MRWALGGRYFSCFWLRSVCVKGLDRPGIIFFVGKCFPVTRIWVLAAYIPDTFSVVDFLLIGTASESILLSYALSDRFKNLLLKEAALPKHVRYYRDLSLMDELTGLYNKRYLKQILEQEIDTTGRDTILLTLLVIDIDDFKIYNDRYGHWEGDQILIRVGEILLATLEGSQRAFRYGGEEFVVLLPHVDCNGAVPFAERIREKIQDEVFTPVLDTQAAVTVSIGIAVLKDEDRAKEFFERADAAMYKAKTDGKNRVVCL